MALRHRAWRRDDLVLCGRLCAGAPRRASASGRHHPGCDMSAPLIETRHVTRILPGIVPTTLVRDVSLAIGEREFVAITGPSGSGKSSLLYLLGLLDLPTSGEVLIRGRATTSMSEPERGHIR